MTMRISTRLWLMIGLAFALFITAIGIGLHGLQTSADALRSTYRDRMIPMEMLSELAAVLRENRTEVYRIFQHAHDDHLSKLHNDSIGTHLTAIEKRVAEGDRLWQAYLATYITEEEQVLVTDFTQKRAGWLTNMNAALSAAKAGDFSRETIENFSEQGDDTYRDAMGSLVSLRNFQLKFSEHEFNAAEYRYRNSLIFYAALAMLGFLLLTASAYLLLRRINRGLRDAAAATLAIADGKLHTLLPPAISDEIGEIMAYVGTMRDKLRDLLETSRLSEARSRAILRTMRDGVVHINAQGSILTINDVVVELANDRFLSHSCQILTTAITESCKELGWHPFAPENMGTVIQCRRRLDAVTSPPCFRRLFDCAGLCSAALQASPIGSMAAYRLC
jgi:methyl-accepting chemotaxis protein